MHCTLASSTLPSSSLPHELPPPTHPPPGDSPIPNSQGETPAWESCGRIPEKERADFWEFVACNVLFAAISLFVLFARSKRLQALKGRQLAARIGLVRGGVGDGTWYFEWFLSVLTYFVLVFRIADISLLIENTSYTCNNYFPRQPTIWMLS